MTDHNRIDVTPPTPLFRDSYLSDRMAERLAYSLYSTLLNKLPDYDLIVVCIGTDRSTGDALGPLIGSKLKALDLSNMHVYGTLDHPVHAMNLEETLATIKRQHHAPYILAIDACLGELKSVGKVTLAKGPLKPGAGVQKKLPEVGQLHLTGIVNVGGFMEYFVLQNTRLSVVMKMADQMSKAIEHASAFLKRANVTRQPVYDDSQKQDRLFHIRAKAEL
jgi:putative sporulation protein YyaC